MGANMYLVEHGGSNRFFQAAGSSDIRCRGLDWFEGNLYNPETQSGKIHKYNGFSSTVLDSFSYSGFCSNIWGITFETAFEYFDVTLKYKNAGASFVEVTSALGDTGIVSEIPGSFNVYWDNPAADRPGVEVTDEVMRIEANPSPSNEYSYDLTLDSAAQLTAADGTGDIGDVKVGYTFTQLVSSSLLLHMDGTDASTTFTDSSGNGHTVTPNGTAQIDTAQSKFGGASALFNNSESTYLRLPATHSSLNFAGSDWTIECWVRFSTLGGHSMWFSADSNFHIYFNSSLGLRIQSNSGINFDIYQGNTAGWATNTWHHVAAVKNGGAVRGYRDGVEICSDTTVSGTHPSYTNITIGRYSAATGFAFAGHIDEYRIIKEAVYTSGFTPPTAPF